MPCVHWLIYYLVISEDFFPIYFRPLLRGVQSTLQVREKKQGKDKPTNLSNYFRKVQHQETLSDKWVIATNLTNLCREVFLRILISKE